MSADPIGSRRRGRWQACTVTKRNGGVYDERLYVPLRWWVQATMLVATFWLAFVVALEPVLAWAASGVLLAGAVALLLGYGAARVRVHDGMLVAGRAQIPVTLLDDPMPLDAQATRLLAGRDADVRAFLLLRPYLKRSVRVWVTDPADPTPYWLLATRHPETLADAIVSARMSEPRQG
jgi:hypothetical protein